MMTCVDSGPVTCTDGQVPSEDGTKCVDCTDGQVPNEDGTECVEPNPCANASAGDSCPDGDPLTVAETCQADANGDLTCLGAHCS